MADAAGAAPKRRRIGSALAVAVVHALLGYAFLVGLGVRVPTRMADGLKVFDVTPAPPPPPAIPPPARMKSARRQGAAAPRNLRSRATEVVAAQLPVLLPPPVVAAPLPGLGEDPSAGASNVRGPGAGSGGPGNGTGSGMAGNGEGAGGRALRWRSGRIKDSDYPRAALAVAASGTVRLRFTVGVTGRVTDCTVTGTSGNADLDETTCRLIRERFRYKPSTDASGRPIPDEVTGEHEWTLYRPDDPPRQ